MNKNLRNKYKEPLVGSFGWLFADLLLALTMIFLVTSTVIYPSTNTSETKITPVVLPKPTLPPPLKLQPQCLSLNLTNYQDLLNHLPEEIQSIKNQVNIQIKPFKNRLAGFVQIYGGASGTDIDTALSIADAIRTILETYSALFIRNSTIYHQSFYHPDMNPNKVIIEVYLYDTHPDKTYYNAQNVFCPY